MTQYPYPGGNMRRARDLAMSADLLSISYLDKNGNNGARGKAVDKIKLSFSNHEDVYLTPEELKMLDDVEFNLQKA